MEHMWKSSGRQMRLQRTIVKHLRQEKNVSASESRGCNQWKNWHGDCNIRKQASETKAANNTAQKLHGLNN